MPRPTRDIVDELRLAHEAQRWAVLRQAITDGRTSDAERDRHVKAFLDYARALNWPLDRLWALGNGTRLTWSCATLQSPGRSSMLMVPFPTSMTVAQVATMVRRILNDEKHVGTRLVQSLLYLEDKENQAALESAGFHEIAVLQYLEGATRDAPSHRHESALDSPNWVHYSPTHHASFCELITATYRESLDCPGLAAMREIEDVVEGHKGAGRFEPANWYLLRNGTTPVACALFGASPLRPTAELVYMGVHPAFRGQGIGRMVLTHGLAEMRRAGIRGVTLAVDSRNVSAQRLYASAGFRRTHIRRALVHSTASNA